MAALLKAVPTPARGSSEFFCSNPRCAFHVRVGDPGVEGSGDWAQLTLRHGERIATSHRWISGELLCDLCVRKKRLAPRAR